MRNFLYWNVILVLAIVMGFAPASAAETLPVELAFEEAIFLKQFLREFLRFLKVAIFKEYGF